ncbi:diacylglycerol/lipid kinase family protein [Bacillus massiliglaciei]|uniref:diacylglycerol/lipid kinase family protein n=1 Tax=Bacillus massiliglaciei TaxID=1816693 RepID=UPI000ABC5541|nr:diacylglycerol kinase family protein [Bacillus massiliglaciei]
MKKAMLIINPTAGKDHAPALGPHAESVLQQLYDQVIVCQTEKEGDAAAFAGRACQEAFDAVIAMGGDGTVNEAVNGLAEYRRRPSFGVIPLGTVNDFARALGIPLDPLEAIGILQQQFVKSSDLGKINDRFFMNVLAVGEIAEAAYKVSTEQKSRFGPLAYLFEGTKTLIHKTPFPLMVEHDQGRWIGQSYLLIAAMTNSVGGFEKMAPEAKVNDGTLHVFIIKDLSVPLVMQILFKLVRGELKEHDAVEYIKTSFLNVQSEKESAVNIDGDEGVPLPFRAQVMPGHLDVFVSKGREDPLTEA